MCNLVKVIFICSFYLESKHSAAEVVAAIVTAVVMAAIVTGAITDWSALGAAFF